MMQQCVSFWMSLRTSIVVLLLIIEISQEASCLIIRKQGRLTLDNYRRNINVNHNSYVDYGQNSTFIPVVEDSDPNYPYEQILQLVKDTKRILRSSNHAEKKKLNLDPRIYDDYLSGDLSDSNFEEEHRLSTDAISESLPASSVGYGSPSVFPLYNQCPEDIQYQIPQRLTGIDDKEYYIINVGNDLKQKYNSVLCRNSNEKCGAIYAVQDYSYACKQSYNRIRDFVSIEVGNQISVDQQRLQFFRLPDGCSCQSSRNVD